MIRVLYFARLREQLGLEREELEMAALPDLAALPNLAILMETLRGRGGVWQDAFGGDQRLMMAVNQELAEPGTVIQDGDEIAFFPPVTGG
jgi:sulfur-carrier protein